MLYNKTLLGTVYTKCLELKRSILLRVLYTKLQGELWSDFKDEAPMLPSICIHFVQCVSRACENVLITLKLHVNNSVINHNF
jgi:hypothetical protein